MSNTTMTSKSTLRFHSNGVVVDSIDFADFHNQLLLCNIPDTDRRHIAEVAANIALFDAAAAKGLRLGVAVYCNDGRVGVTVSAMKGANGKSLLCGGTPFEAVLVTTAASLLQQV